jgi:hypothetical protein
MVIVSSPDPFGLSLSKAGSARPAGRRRTPLRQAQGERQNLPFDFQA